MGGFGGTCVCVLGVLFVCVGIFFLFLTDPRG